MTPLDRSILVSSAPQPRPGRAQQAARSEKAGDSGFPIQTCERKTTLGWLRLAATEAGICWLAFNDAPGNLGDDLRATFPAARIEDDQGSLEWAVGPIAGFLQHPDSLPGLPLDLRGTPFQRTVWAALRTIPTGQTRSYGEIARALGRPRAARAVAAACASNRIAVLIPCHRVIAADGGLSGYRWGAERKAELLRREGVAV